MKTREISRKIINIICPNSKYERNSYSQCGEDLIVYYIFQNIIKNNNPTYIDIGAHHPFNMSNSALLHSKGFKGINIEPNPYLIKSFEKYRPNDVNLNIGISNSSGRLVFYNLSDQALSSFSKVEVDILIKNQRITLLEEIEISVSTITDVISKYANNKFPNFLSLDVEGFDEQILRSINYDNTSPDVICVETIKYEESGRYSKNEYIINFLKSRNYEIYGETRINTIFIAKKYLNYTR